MGKIIDKMNEARAVVAEIMESGGEFSEAHEELLSKYETDSNEQAEWLGQVYRRAKSESGLIDLQIKGLMAEKKRANQTASWARDTMAEVLITREAAGQATNIPGVAHLMKQTKLVIPDDPDLWPVEFLRERPVTLDTVSLKRKYKDAQSQDLPDGFEWRESFAVVMK
jgi:hypothetical protein|tara:strand:+ start:1234 stop:1737 length:504 start_codon:yes stop_codon:yes gene_type:complete